MINVLVDTLPTEWKAPDGSAYAIDTDFRIGIQLCLLQEDTELTKREKAVMMMELLFTDAIPGNAQDVGECVTFFLMAGFMTKKGGKEISV